MGLSLPVEKISFGFGGPDGIRLVADPEIDNDLERWSFCSLVIADHRLSAVVVHQSPLKMSLWEVRPLLASPVLLGDCKAQWFPRT